MSESQHKQKAGPVSLAVLLLAMGGGNMYQGSKSVDETRALQASITEMRKEVQGMATTVTLLKWRVSNLEGVKHGSNQGT